MPTGKVGDYITYMADRNLHNPVANWIESKPWDGQSRLQDLYDTVASHGDEDLKNTIMRRWLISAVAAAFNPTGVSAHGVLVFQGAQYMGKTAWFKRLVPKELGVVQDGMMLRPDDRDSVKQVVSHWLVELGELDATFRKSDIAQLKAFLTRDKDILRRAYARKESEFARRTVFFASVNPKEFLHDQTGNRRFWVIECKSIEYDHGIDMQQLWAEVLTLYRAGEPWTLQGDEHNSLEEHNKTYEVIDPIEELIASGLRWNEPPAAWRWRSATEVLAELGRDTCTQGEATRAAHLIRQRNGNLSRKANGARALLAPEAWGSRNRP
jgi:putative DNA primase/helicase